jgi:ribosomal protein S4
MLQSFDILELPFPNLNLQNKIQGGKYHLHKSCVKHEQHSAKKSKHGQIRREKRKVPQEGHHPTSQTWAQIGVEHEEN